MKVTIPKAGFDAAKQLEDIKASIIYKDVPRYLKAGQKKGFPTDPKNYQLFFKTRGKTTRRQLKTIRPQYMRIPAEFLFVSKGNMKDVLDAVQFAYSQARARAPSKSGTYKRNIGIMTNNDTSPNAPIAKIPLDTIFYVTSLTAYASIIELGFYTGYYKTKNAGNLRDGILYHVAKLTEKKFGNLISCEFGYLGGVGKTKYSGGGTVPVVKIAAAGQLKDSGRRPGRSRARKSRRATRRNRRRW